MLPTMPACVPPRARMVWNAYELELMVERGLSPEQALLTATRNAAEALGAGDRLGTLEPGKLADLLVIDGEPDRDVRVLQDPARLLVVMQGGRLVVDRRAERRVDASAAI